jgi:hypothetical protein
LLPVGEWRPRRSCEPTQEGGAIGAGITYAGAPSPAMVSVAREWEVVEYTYEVPRKAAVKKVTPAKKSMSDTHKAALAVGRDEGRAVRRYLEALDAHKPRPGRKRTPDGVQRQLDETVEALAHSSALDRVLLLQRRLDLESELKELTRQADTDLGELERAFVEALPGYSARKHLSYAAWREAGVPARVLRAAGIRRVAS